ncbi:MAG: UDP-N-acetylmuramoyl-L-alanyl-D-glutamate--2,6-diaminopimelate ligase, partial [Proteobacteria bacterium SW_6_67_9]
VPGLAERVGTLASTFYGEPGSRLDDVLAVTGTDGKTTVAQFLAAMLDEPGAPAVALGTLGTGTQAPSPTGLTTPDAPRLQANLAHLVEAGVRRVALEASSHALDQRRLDGTRVDVAVFTQLGRDHLDYHGSQAAYAQAKSRLFERGELQGAAINADDAFERCLRERLASGVRCVTYGRRSGELRIEDVAYDIDGIVLTLRAGDARGVARLPVLGPFNADNAAAAAAALRARGFSFADTMARLERIRPVAGRMEPFRRPRMPAIVVDYAHTGGALAAALAAVRAHTHGRVWCIFGAGGDRDPGKRAPMGAAAAAGADQVIVTDDNPRSEEPGAITRDILAGAGDAEARVEHDRGRALQWALEQAGPDDLILLAGKGHETVQIRAGTELAWSDREAAERALGGGGDR